ncbi:type II secretion system protein [Clostridium cuniculi]|uniref:type II secretion system protein n=1 Tax=Clostridium cuniculi TaxID=2548455 RepID=UPI0018A89DAF|nr:prepilin-type N-terminal cleavage/methylation domain-containing protein [Clostridium cuniculi]
MNLKKKKKGFTLIELMAVIAIIAILAAVLVPTVNGYINRSKKTAIVTQARTLMNAIETYNLTSTTEGTSISTESNSSTVASLFDEKNGAFKEEDLVTEDSVNKILKATITEVKTINDNVKGDILNKIVLGDDSTSIKDTTIKDAFSSLK